MPRLTCRSCGRQVYTTAPVEELVVDERRCPRCGSLMHSERRELERRTRVRRTNPPHDPGPPLAPPDSETAERRTAERRAGRRRGGGSSDSPPPARSDEAGWQD